MWQKGKRRNQVSGALFFKGLVNEGFSRYQIARAAQVSEKTIRRWISEEDFTTLEKIQLAFDRLFPAYKHRLPLYEGGPLDANSRVLGVSQYTIESSQPTF